MKFFHFLKVASFLVLLLALLAGPNFIALGAEPQSNAAPDTILVKFREGTAASEIEKVHRANKATIEEGISAIKVQRVSVGAATARAALARYKNDPRVEYAEPDYVAEAYAVTNDPKLSSQWGMFKIQAANSAGQSAWDLTKGSSAVKIAVLDTGINSSHPDITGKVVGSKNFTTSRTLDDKAGHGTHVAGIAAAKTNNAKGVAGTGYNSSLMNVKVLGDNGSGYYSWIANGIIWAADNGAKVINMSLGGTAGSQALQDAVNYAWNKGVVVVAAAGNSGSSSPSYPAYYDNVIAVAATNSTDGKPSWSNFGAWVDVAAPGESIYSTYKTNTYASLSGTSMASPFVAGEAGLVWATGVCATNTCVRGKIESTADPIAGTGSLWAFGRINAYRAVTP